MVEVVDWEVTLEEVTEVEADVAVVFEVAEVVEVGVVVDVLECADEVDPADDELCVVVDEEGPPESATYAATPATATIRTTTAARTAGAMPRLKCTRFCTLS